VLAATLAANALIFLDQTAVTVALPDIAREFSSSGSELQWTIGAYLLALAVLMPAVGRLADLYGRRRLFVAGIAIFGLASIACALAPTQLALILARVAQGAGGAMIQTLALANATAALGPERRGWTIGALATGGTTFLLAGPVVGGALVEIADWRLVFAVNVPICAYALAETRRYLPETRDEGAAPVDGVAVALLLVGFSALISGLLEMHTWGPGSPATIGAIGGGVALVGLFVLRELRDPKPMIDVRLLEDRRVAGAMLALTAIQFSVIAVTVYLMLFLQHGLGYGALAAGLLFLPTVMWTALLSIRTGRLADRHGPRRMVIGGFVAAVAGLVWLALSAGADDVFLMMPGMLMFGISRPFIFTPAATVPVGVLPLAKRGFASSLVSESRQVGAVLGVAVIGAVVAGVESGHAAPLRPGTLAGAFEAGMLVCAGLCLAALLVALATMPTEAESAEVRSREA
jgi:EmrB/QacA subfamily drug resistance transporter